MGRVRRKIFSPSISITVQFCCLRVLCHSVLTYVGLLDGQTHTTFFARPVLLQITLFAISIKVAFLFPAMGVRVWREVSEVEKSSLVCNTQILRLSLQQCFLAEDVATVDRILAGVNLFRKFVFILQELKILSGLCFKCLQ